jgi:hypothetical protein
MDSAKAGIKLPCREPPYTKNLDSLLLNIYAAIESRGIVMILRNLGREATEPSNRFLLTGLFDASKTFRAPNSCGSPEEFTHTSPLTVS